MSRSPTGEELEVLYARIAAFVTGRLRNAQSPSLSARSMVHCKQLATHYRIPLSGVNQLRFNGNLARELDDSFPGWEALWLPDPDNSKMEYALMVPLELAVRSKSSSKKQRYYSDLDNGGGGGSLSVLLLGLLGLIVFGMVVWWIMIPGLMK